MSCQVSYCHTYYVYNKGIVLIIYWIDLGRGRFFFSYWPFLSSLGGGILISKDSKTGWEFANMEIILIGNIGSWWWDSKTLTLCPYQVDCDCSSKKKLVVCGIQIKCIMIEEWWQLRRHCQLTNWLIV